MTLFTLFLAGIVPAALLILAGLLILHSGSPQTASRRFLVYLLSAALLLLLAIFVAGTYFAGQDNRISFAIPALLTPAILGILALTLVNLRRLAGMHRNEKILAFLLGIALLGMLFLVWRQPDGIGTLLPAGVLLLALTWMLANRSGKLNLLLSLAALFLLIFFNLRLSTRLDASLPAWLNQVLSILFFITPGLVVALAAVLVSTALRMTQERPDTGEPAMTASRFPVFLRLGLAACLLALLGYTIVWASIWDQTSDGLGGLFLTMYSAPVAIAAGMLVSATSTGLRRAAGLGFAVLVPLLIIAAFRNGWDISYHAITEGRAARIQRALEAFHSRLGRYPLDLKELAPRDLLFIPQPVIFRGETWCYQAEAGSYRLGAFYREYFSSPVSLRIYTSTGELSQASWACGERLAEMKERYDPPPMEEWVEQIPTAVPQPTSQIPIDRESVQPLVRARLIAPGDWSPDGNTWFFGIYPSSSGGSSPGLYFLDAGTGQVCQAGDESPPEAGLRQQHAWLPDGHLLFVSESGGLAVLKPCEPEVEHLDGRFPVPFQQAAAYDPLSGRVLLQSADSYWILDYPDFEARPVPEVSPNPYDLHWDNFAWTRGGEKLAISRLNGRDRKEGSTLYLVSGDSGQVEQSLPLEMASDQSAPIVEWLDEDKLLLHGQGDLLVFDFRSNPASITRVLTEIFGLDLDYPGEISAMASLPNEDGQGYHLIVRANHPRNQAVYLYHSEDGRVEVLHPEVHALLFFPGGKWIEMPKFELLPAFRDEYDLYWIDTPGKEPQHLSLAGHTPREYPHLSVRYLPDSNRLAVTSAQGVSLAALPGGELLEFWNLAGAESGFSPYLRVPKSGGALVAVVDGVGVYYIPLDSRE